MARPTALAFPVGTREVHEVVVELRDRDLVVVSLDGVPRVSLRPHAMLGGYAFDVGEAERHRIEVFFVDAQPPRLEARVDGVPVRVDPPRAQAPLAAVLVLGGVGLAWLALAVLALARIRIAAELGFDEVSVAVGACLVLLAGMVLRGHLWATEIAALLLPIELGIFLVRQAGPPAGGAVLLKGAVSVLLVFLAIVLFAGRRKPAPRRAPALSRGEVLGRCSAHGSFAHASCARCGRLLCSECACYARGRDLLCETCAGVPPALPAA